MYVSWEDLQVFRAVAELGSFSAAARSLHLTQPTVSRRIAQLEERLGQQVFRRDVEGARPTALGARLLPAAEQMARFAAEAERVVQALGEPLAGTVACALRGGDFGEVLVRLGVELRARHPQLRLCQVEGAAEGGLPDVVLASASPHEPGLEIVARHRVRVGAFAAADYVERVGQCVAAHRIEWIDSYGAEPGVDRVLRDALGEFTPALSARDHALRRAAARAGLGAIVLPHVVNGPTADGLVPLDVGLDFPERELVVARPANLRWVPRLLAALECLETVLQGSRSAS